MKKKEVTLKVVVSKDLEKRFHRFADYVGRTFDEVISMAMTQVLRAPQIYARLAYMEKIILDIIGDYPDGIHTSLIRLGLEKKIKESISYSAFNNRIYSLYAKRKLIKRKSKGIYVIKGKRK